ncbi:sulfatase-like hydrolase/transferase [Zobellia uliginosa]|uniref:sulfatase-like hydrolase/transferase n=1 Tax=Zobellia uliginosa TaxID=143224 RepID=UPI001C06A8A5|nr:sulfatase-like hydrolase/transferase [Zobellia uliginosa]MBU2945811.1 sulfatase-like hydrolase/transferase [Zobellia uliginosa]
MKIRSNYFIYIWLFLGTCFGKLVAQNPSKNRPNIILIMMDDLGYEGIGNYGGTSYNTPNIDKMAVSGMQFNQAYAQPLCAPTRVKLMTGKYNFRNWEAFGILDPNEKTFGHLMQDAGYATCIVGKWQLQSYDPPEYPGSEYRRGTGMKVDKAGFDEYSLWHTSHTEDKGSRYADPTIFQNGKFLSDTKGKYGPDIFSAYLNEYVGRPHNKPFFIYYPMALTHGPFTPTPQSEDWKDPTKRHDDNVMYFKDMVEYADKIIGDIITNLEKNGLRENTLILFYSDNGTPQSIYSKIGNKTIQGGKGLTTEAGVKVPFIANWPEQIAAGSVSNEFVDAIDFLPTILEVAQVPIPKNFHTDGQSFLPVLKGRPSNRRDWIYMSYNPKPGWDKDQFADAEFVFNDKYKLYGDGRFYETASDVFEKKILTTANLSPNERRIRDRFGVIIDSLKKYPSYGSIERLDPGLDIVVTAHARIDLVAEGFNRAEGPVWMPNGQKLLFSDVPENKIYQWNDLDGLSLYLKPSEHMDEGRDYKGMGSKSLTFDLKGNLVLSKKGDHVISRLISIKDSSNPKFEPLITGYNGKKFNSPNDLIYDRKGNLYFTDFSFGSAKEKSEIGFNGVYFFSKDGELSLLDKSLKAPNGIALSNDNKILYIADSEDNQPKVIAYDIVKNGIIENKRIFFDATKLRKATIDNQSLGGITIDKKGNIFIVAHDGVLILSPNGEHLGTIKTGKKATNCEFSDDGRHLFITTNDCLLRVKLRPYTM